MRPVVSDARVRGARFAADTFTRVHPALDEVLDKVTPAVDAGVRRVQPAVDDALTRIPPTVDFARSKVQDEFLKNLSAVLQSAAAQQLTSEVKAAVATATLASQQLAKVEDVKKRSGWKLFGKILVAGALAGGVAVAVRKLLADPSTGWESHAPNGYYVADPVDLSSETEPKVTTFMTKAQEAANEALGKVKDVADDLVAKVKDATDDLSGKAKEATDDLSDAAEDVADDLSDKAEDAKGAVADVAEDVADKAEDVADEVSDAAGDVADDLADKAEDAKGAAKDVAEDVEEQLAKLADEADEAEGDDASPLAGSPYGEGSYVGDEPPQGYEIKGNDRSMKYHLPGSAAYERTIAEVWFASAEAAEAAGFVRAQR
ncbi:MAG: hypothetical protein WAL91_09810 [Propionicimonas sp.]